MRVLVAYDVHSHRRRRQVAHLLSGCGVRVNRSVFECEVRDAAALDALWVELERLVKPRRDHVRLYPICLACLDKRREVGHSPWGEMVEGVEWI